MQSNYLYIRILVCNGVYFILGAGYAKQHARKQLATFYINTLRVEGLNCGLVRYHKKFFHKIFHKPIFCVTCMSSMAVIDSTDIDIPIHILKYRYTGLKNS